MEASFEVSVDYFPEKIYVRYYSFPSPMALLSLQRLMSVGTLQPFFFFAPNALIGNNGQISSSVSAYGVLIINYLLI